MSFYSSVEIARRYALSMGFSSSVSTVEGVPEFVSTWDTTNTSALSSSSTQVKLPLESTGTYDFIVDWGDDTSDEITAFDQAEVTHTYAESGVYELSITGTITGFRFNDTGDKLKLTDVSNWGPLNPGNNGHQFRGAANMTVSATDTPDLSGVTNMLRMFRGCSQFNGAIGNWDMSAVTNIEKMFQGATSFNQPIGSWDLSSLTNMENLFRDAASFNQPIGNWNVSGVDSMADVFRGATAFNQPLGSWDVSNVIFFFRMFQDATSFDQDINGWNVSSATTMASMFQGSNFNQPIGNWDLSSIDIMTNMFRDNTVFNQDISGWNMSSARNIDIMFFGATAFNQPIGSWDTSNVQQTFSMFQGATAFDQDLGAWDVTNITLMDNMFNGATLSTPNYDSILTGWESQLVQNSVNFHGGNSQYSAGAPATARAALINDHSWTITDGGQAA